MPSLQRAALAWLIASAISFSVYFLYMRSFDGTGFAGDMARLIPLAALLIAGYTVVPALLTLLARRKTGWPTWALGAGIWSVLVTGVMTPFLLKAGPIELAVFFLPMLVTQAVSGAAFGGIVARAPKRALG